MYRYFVTLVSVVILFSAYAEGQSILYDPTPNDPNAELGRKFNSVVGLFGHFNNDPNSYWMGNGVVTHNNNSLFATAHQFGTSYDYYSVRTGNNLANDFDGIFFTNSSPVFHPTWNGNWNTSRDLAFLRFDDPILGITPAQFYTGEINLGNTITTVGVGRTANVFVGQTFYDYQKRGIVNTIESFGTASMYQPEDEIWHLTTFFRGPNHQNYNLLGGNAGPGNSGSGDFIDDILDGDDFKDIMDQYLVSLASSADLAVGFDRRTHRAVMDVSWGMRMASVPEPSSGMLLGFFSLCLLCKRPTRKVFK